MTVVTKPTQEIIPIKEIRDGVVILKDGSLHIVLMASTLNFALKSEDEQNAIIFQYQNFLNSLDFPVQFFIESRKLNISPYIATLEEAERQHINELLKIQTREYIEFVKNFVKSTSIVSKTFYLVVSYTSSAIGGSEGLLGKAIKGFKTQDQDSSDQFDKNKIQLQQRADVVAQGLARAGVRVVVLNTEELIELFYKLFNPGELERETIASVISNQ